MRQINEHRNAGFTTLQINAVDEPVLNGPNYRYDILGFNTSGNRSAVQNGVPAMITRVPIVFHKGPVIADTQQNGITTHALVAVLADHLSGLQKTDEACVEYQMALNYLKEAQKSLDKKVVVPYANKFVADQMSV